MLWKIEMETWQSIHIMKFRCDVNVVALQQHFAGTTDTQWGGVLSIVIAT